MLERPSYTVGAARNAARILRYLGAHGEPVRLARVAADLELHASTCLNILRTLCDEGLVHHQPAGKTYSLGLGLVEIARRALRQGEDLRIIRPMMERLARQHDVTLMLWRRVGADHLVLLTWATGNSGLHIGADVGTRMPLLTGSMGRVIAGFGDLDETTLRDAFSSIDWQSSLDFATFMDQAAEARRRGWAVDNGYYHKTRSGLSAPVPTAGAPTERILNAAIFADQFDDAGLATLGGDLLELASAIGRGASG